ncbi:MAG: histidine phosphatase family protein [Bacteroidetes bacterium]|nr:histidine phosphatase family protein [Bacteroidota bacterium]
MLHKEIYIVRHGQTDFNLKGIVQGRGVDSELNLTGQQQALAFFEHYKHIDFDHIFISELQRTKQTVQHFIDTGIPYQSFPSLDEINWGIYEGVVQDHSMKLEYENIIGQWRNDELHIKIEGGESAADLWERQASFIQLLKDMEFNRVLVCSHGRSIRALMCALTDTPLKDMDSFSHYNTCLYKVRYSDGKFEVEVENSIIHLPEALQTIKME